MISDSKQYKSAQFVNSDEDDSSDEEGGNEEESDDEDAQEAGEWVISCLLLWEVAM